VNDARRIKGIAAHALSIRVESPGHLDARIIPANHGCVRTDVPFGSVRGQLDPAIAGCVVDLGRRRIDPMLGVWVYGVHDHP